MGDKKRCREHDLMDESSLIQEEQVDYAPDRKLTYEDYAKLPNETGYTIQLIDGLIVREPSPSVLHQKTSANLQYILTTYFREVDPKSYTLNAPLDLRLDQHTVVQPDVLYFPSTRPVKKAPVDSLPELVTEIASPSTARTDRIRKYTSYQKAGIPHYWIVDPNQHFIECFRLQEEIYHRIAAFDDGTFSHPDFPGLTFDLKELWAEP